MKVAGCAFCNNSSHNTGNCNSNTNGRRTIQSYYVCIFIYDNIL